MADTQQLTMPDPPDTPPPTVRRRTAIAMVAIAVVAALLGVLIGVAVSQGGDDDGRTPAAAPSDEGIDTRDPIRPEGRATLDPSTRSDTEAAIRNNWPLVANDEFDGTELNTALWSAYSGETTGGVGQHDPDNLSVSNGTLKITSHGYSSGGMAWSEGQQHGRWEVRARTQQGTGYGAVILLWPDAEDWPEGGEINFMEIPKGQRNESHFVLHYGENNSQIGTTIPGDFTQWHNYAVEWGPDHVAGFIDGQETFRSTDPKTIPPRPMHLAMQQDIGPYGKDWIPPLDDTTPAQVQLEVDWVRIYGF